MAIILRYEFSLKTIETKTFAFSESLSSAVNKGNKIIETKRFALGMPVILS